MQAGHVMSLRAVIIYFISSEIIPSKFDVMIILGKSSSLAHNSYKNRRYMEHWEVNLNFYFLVPLARAAKVCVFALAEI